MSSKSKQPFYVVGMQAFCECLREDVCYVVDQRNMFECDLSIAHMLVDVVMAYGDVFCLLVPFGGECEGNGGGIVAIEGRQEGLVKSDLPQNPVHPQGLLCCSSYCHIFCLG